MPKLTALCTEKGFIPVRPYDIDEFKKCKTGQEFLLVIRFIRSPEFHRKYFAMLRFAYQNLPEKFAGTYPTSELFRKTVQVMAGEYDRTWNLDTGEEIVMPKSIAYESLDNAQFSSLYDRVCDVLLRNFFEGMTKQDIIDNLTSFF